MELQKTWWKEAVVYQIYPRSFQDSNGDGIGDLPGIVTRLDYLKELGVDVIWLSPICQSPNTDNGYDISNYCKILDEFGTMEDFDYLIKEAHRRELKIVFDLVVNHTSDEHAWFVDSRKSKENPYRDYYIWRSPKNGGPPNNWGSRFSGPAWTLDDTTGMYYLHLFDKKQPDLNWDNEQVRNSIYEMMRWWLDKGIDGFRMDVISFISKRPGLPDGPQVEGSLYGSAVPMNSNGPRVHEYLHEMYENVLSHYDIMTVGETPGVTVEEAKRYAGLESEELNMVFQFEHMHVDYAGDSKWIGKPFRLSELKRIMSKWQEGLSGQAWNSLYWCNHDQPRIVSRFGNDSTEALRSKSAKMLATCLHMLQGTPYIYQGEELGMTNVRFPTLSDYRDVDTIGSYRELTGKGVYTHQQMMERIYYISRDNARTPMQWDTSESAGFSTAQPWIGVNPNYRQINAASQVDDPASVFQYYQKLIRLRKQHEIIVYGDYCLLEPEDERVYAYLRRFGGQTLLCVSNFTDTEALFTLPDSLQEGNGTLLISNEKASDTPERQMALGAYEARVYLVG